ncbi:hypothetical protein [Phytohabitans rumicis]|uniref:Uncharacterized protein n=1 Tax=Phytohabitans rumicis TaxID=1076125 RepID=A0A6V8LE19_9ACTN|nr:hypothetical protein [Phytohabitans rumicis]GFJ95461.1 hypothetical protein Prum_091030 [Phytohabitans rumicis]GFJ95473.1 hypothetical protein Prum_091150 [Phytohabitans rumicis]
MERQRSAAMSRTEFVAVVVVNYLVGAFFFVMALLIVSGVVTVAGWGEGTLVQRVVVGLLAIVLGGAGVAGATIQLLEGRAGNRPAEGARVVRSGPFWAGVRVEDGYGEVSFGVGSPDGRHDGSGTHPGVGEF